MSLYDSNGDGVPIPGAITNKILNLSEFFIHYVDKRTHDWTAHNEFDLETFMLTGTGPLTPPNPASVPSVTPVAPTIDTATIQAIAAAVGGATTSAISRAPKTADPLDTFLKNKWTSEAYKPFHEAKYWNQWYRAFVAIATSQGLEDVLNPTYSLGTTATAGDLALWNAKQKHAYAILSSCLLESGSQQIVQQYSNKDDLSTFGHAQHIYRDLVAHFQHGVAASTSLDTLERDMVALRLGKKWNKTLEAFLLLADHKLRDHQGLADHNNYPDSWYIKKLNAMFSGHAEIISYLGQLQVQELNYLRLAGVAVTTALTYEVHYTQIRDFCITLDGRNKEAAEMKHARSIMKAEIKRSMNVSQADPGTAPSTAQPARGHGSGRGRGQGRGRGGRDRGRGRSGGRGCYHNYLPDDQYWNLGQSSYDKLVHGCISSGEIQSNNVDTQALPSNSSTPSSVVPPAVTTTTPVVPDAPSALTTPTRQVHTAHVTPSTAGSTSTQMDSGPPILLRQMLSSASARSQPAASDGSITTTFGAHKYNVRHINHTLYRYSYNIHENRIQSTHGALVDSGANGGMAVLEV